MGEHEENNVLKMVDFIKKTFEIQDKIHASKYGNETIDGKTIAAYRPTRTVLKNDTYDQIIKELFLTNGEELFDSAIKLLIIEKYLKNGVLERRLKTIEKETTTEKIKGE